MSDIINTDEIKVKIQLSNRDTLIFIMTFIMFAITLLMAFTFLAAYLSPTKQITLDINAYGEANLEFIMFLIILPLATITMYLVGIDKMRLYSKENKASWSFWFTVMTLTMILILPFFLR